MDISNISNYNLNNTKSDIKSETSKTEANSEIITSNVEGVDKNPISTEINTNKYINITDQAKLMLKLEQEMAKAPEIDINKVQAIKQKLADNSFTINNYDLADKIIAMEQKL